MPASRNTHKRQGGRRDRQPPRAPSVSGDKSVAQIGIHSTIVDERSGSLCSGVLSKAMGERAREISCDPESPLQMFAAPRGRDKGGKSSVLPAWLAMHKNRRKKSDRFALKGERRIFLQHGTFWMSGTASNVRESKRPSDPGGRTPAFPCWTGKNNRTFP